jgi:hypothetical protein
MFMIHREGCGHQRVKVVWRSAALPLASTFMMGRVKEIPTMSVS